MGLLDGKRILITGVLMDSSIAFHVARIAQQEGAEVVLTSFGRTMRITQTIAKRLPSTPPIVELDASNAADFEALADRVREHVDGLDGVLHSIGFAPEAALGGNFLNTSWEDVSTAVQISAYSLKALAVAAKSDKNCTPIAYLARLLTAFRPPAEHCFTAAGKLSPYSANPVICVREYFGYTRQAPGESGNWQPCLKNYLQFLSACCWP